MFSNSDWLIITTIHIIVWLLVYCYSQGRIDTLDSFYFSSGLYWLIFVFAPLVWILRDQTSYQGIEVMEYMPEGMIVFNIGYFVYAFANISRKKFVLGDYMPGEKYLDEEYIEYLSTPEVSSRIVLWGWLIFIFSMACATFYYMATGRSLLYMLTFGQGDEHTGGNDGLGIYFLAQFIRSAIPGLLLILAYQKKYKIFAYVCVYILSAVCFTGGSRNLALCVVLSIFVMFYLKRNRRPNIFIVILAVVLMFLFVGFIGIYRQELRGGGTIDLSLFNSENIINAFMYNVEIFFPFFTLVGYIPTKMTIHYGLGILNIPLQFIPRALWHSKPATIGLTAMEAMYGSDFGGSAYPNIGEFYYELGMVGVVIFMFMFGKIMKNLYSKTIKNQNMICWIQYALAFGYLMQFICRGHFASWALDIVFMFLPTVFVQKHMYKSYLKYSARLRTRRGAV